jgi:hypothetical protein
MSGDGISGLDGIRQRQAEQGELLARVDERTQAHGREIRDIKSTVHDVDGKLDGVLSELASSRGVAVQKRSAFGGAIALTAVGAAVSGVVVSILVAVLR